MRDFRIALITISGLFLLFSCNDLEIPDPKYYKGWEQLNVETFPVPDSCGFPDGIKIFKDLNSLKRWNCLGGIPKIDFTTNDILISEFTNHDVVEYRAGAYIYINHSLKKVRFENVTQIRFNNSGLSSNGVTVKIKQGFIIPKIPNGYSLE
ncbi:MAG: hypothetical protein H6607_05670 [Flavobacteriales bacterium]|nr:hypothetical protein [Flavobacteriales bacterium]